MKTNLLLGSAALACSLLFSQSAEAHFGALIPADDIIRQGDNRTLHLDAKFIHPMERHYMEMAKPKEFGLQFNGSKLSLTASLTAAKGKSPDQEKAYTYWQSDYTVKRPGDYTFYVEPEPYWEPSEDLFIVHYTKVCVNVLGLEAGWDQPLGLETEIIPLTRPYGLWTGNLFTGQVLLDGQPVPFSAVEIEYLNESPDNIAVVLPPSDPYVTQVVKTDKNGIFSYAMPKAGWWGFSALSTASWKLPHEGNEKSVEIGAVYWVKTRDMK